MNYYAIIDANNFYVSCERVFQPKLNGVATVVTSSNGGGVILARSNEAKALGVPMAAATFEMKEMFEKKNVIAIPANFALYGDMSQRIASILHEIFPYVEEYSIDESFVFFPNITDPERIYKKCKEVRTMILKWTGIPVSIGIAPTKTLAKVAVKYGKSDPEGTVIIDSDEKRQQLLTGFELQDVWGVGRRLGPKLPAYGITDAKSLAEKDAAWAKKTFSVVLARTINELNGISCIGIEEAPPSPKTTMATGTFTKEITDLEMLREKLKEFTRRAGRHIRKSDVVAGGISVFVRGNRFSSKGRKLRLQALDTFSPPTSYTPEILNSIDKLMSQVFYEGVSVKRAGIMLYNLQPKGHRQLGMFEEKKHSEKDEKAMKVIDELERSKMKRRLFVKI